MCEGRSPSKPRIFSLLPFLGVELFRRPMAGISTCTDDRLNLLALRFNGHVGLSLQPLTQSLLSY